MAQPMTTVTLMGNDGSEIIISGALVGPQGIQGVQGPTGSTGATGPPNTLTIGTVSNGAAGASITGTAPDQVLNLILPSGVSATSSVPGIIQLAGDLSGTSSAPKVNSRTFMATVGSANADYITDGTADDVQIQQAVDAAHTAGGGVVFIRRGTYNLSSNVSIDSKSYVTIMGEGMGVTKLIGKGIVKNNTPITYNVRIQDLTIDMNNVAGSSCIHLGLNSYNFRIVRVELKNTNDKFLLNWGSVDQLLVESCVFYDGGLTVAVDNCAGSQLTTTNNTSIFRNCWSIKQSSLGGGLITTGQTGNLLIDGCCLIDLSNNSYAAVSIENQAGNSKCVQVTNCKTYRVGFGFGVSANANRLAKVILSNNIIEGVAGANSLGGITAQRVDDLTISGNTQSDSTYGIYTLNCGYVKINDNKIKNTNSNSGGVADKAGIYVNGNTYTDVTDNVVWDDQGVSTTLAGIRVVGGSNSVFLNNNKFIGPFVSASIQTTGTQSFMEMIDNTFVGTSSVGTVTSLKATNNTGFNPLIIYAQGNVTGATTFNRLNGDKITATLTGNITVTLTSGKVAGDKLTLILTQDGTGGRVASWPAGFKKAGGTLTLSTAASAVDVIDMTWDGTSWREVSRAMSLS